MGGTMFNRAQPVFLITRGKLLHTKRLVEHSLIVLFYLETQKVLLQKLHITVRFIGPFPHPLVNKHICAKHFFNNYPICFLYKRKEKKTIFFIKG